MNEIDAPLRGLKSVMSVATGVALALATVGSFHRGRFGTIAAGIAVAVIVGVPLLRVLALAVRWWRINDRRFAAGAFALLAVIGTGAIMALL